jgi:hypothetical protein
MAADIMESIQVPLLVKAEEKGEASFLVSDKVSCLVKATFMGNQQPSLGKDSSSLKLIHRRLPIPRCR